MSGSIAARNTEMHKVAADGCRTGAGVPGKSSPVARSASSGTLLEMAFSTDRGERGILELSKNPDGLLLVAKMTLDDGSVLEWTRSVRHLEAVEPALTGMHFGRNTDAKQRLMRIVSESLAEFGEV